MFGSAIIDVMLGIIFVYILLSLLVSQINTVIATTLNIRAKQLRTRAEGIFFDEEIQKKVLAHPIVSLIKPPRTTETSPGDIASKDMETARINKIKPKTFTKALVNVLSDPFLNLYAALGMVADTKEKRRIENVVMKLQTNIDDEEQANIYLAQLHETITQLQPDDRPDRRALLRTLGPLQNAVRAQDEDDPKLLMVINGVSRVEHPAFKQAMETVISGAGNIKQAELAIEEWIENKLSQTSSWYGNTMGYLSLLFGLLLAVLLNIDSINLSLTLWNDDTLRQVVADTARAADLTALEEALVTSEEATTAATSGDDDAADSPDAVLESYSATQETLDQLLELRLPIGWTFRTPSSVEPLTTEDGNQITIYDPLEDSRNLYRVFAVTEPGWLGFIVTKFGGIIITAIATAQGAPFWFDILRRLTGQSSPSMDKDA